MTNIAKGAIKIGASMSMGLKAGDVADELLSSSSGGISQLREQLQSLVGKAVGDESRARFFIFVDDLDRVEPKDAVRILELLKNIIDVPHCVFVLAIDYQVVVKGLEGKFGKPTIENEWEFRSFFDKIIQLPFMMPTSSYKLTDYIKDLLDQVGYKVGWSGSTIANLTDVARLTVGHNPRSLKRLANSLSLINIYEESGPKTKSRRGMRRNIFSNN